MTHQSDNLGDVIGTIMPPMNPVRRKQYQHPRWIENGTGVVIAYVGITVFMLIVVLAVWVSFMFAAQPSLALFFGGMKKARAQVSVPPQCVELAAREGYPTDTMSKSQAARARIRMARLSDNDPIVRVCRDAIAQMRAMQKEMRK